MALDTINSFVSVGHLFAMTGDKVRFEVWLFDERSVVTIIGICCFSVEFARVPEKVCDVLAEVWVAYDLCEFLSSFVAPGNDGGPDQVGRAKCEQVLRCETAACDIAAALSEGEI